MKNDRQLNSFIKLKKINKNLYPSLDRRGKYARNPEIIENIVTKHIEKYKPEHSHYGIAHAPLRKYLDSALTRVKIYKEFVFNKFNPKISFTLFCRIFRKFRYAIGQSQNDLCAICDLSKTHFHSESIENCQECTDFNDHKTFAKQSRIEYQKDNKKRILKIK